MPLGIPNVLNNENKSKSNSWINLFAKIAQDGVLFLTQTINDDTANQLIRILLTFRIEKEKNTIALYVNSNSLINSLRSGIAVVDTIQYIPQNIKTINFGIAASITSLVVRSGKKGIRMVLSYAQFMPYISIENFQGQAQDININLVGSEKLLQTVNKIYLKNRCHKINKITLRRYLSRQYFINRKEALELSLIDQIKSRY
uniref:ATP-dependent Clp protease proteolytic subunit n=1 Tax=Lepidodinium chlorophorum TaxID=107758 RepID=A0A0F7R562_LEPCH|nr:ATP-dependent Clp protease proteolytic subunit [Lepidodinium chlorophorum]BAR72334.1 ATP-dependent Clp protease proteolytic subunit [Lepidodinium chlorophorum]